MAKIQALRPKNLLHQLSIVPLRNENAKEVGRDKTPSGQAFVDFELNVKHGSMMKILAKFFKLRKTKQFRLAGYGLEIYDLIDTENTLLDIIELMITKEQLTFFESRALLLEYIKMLSARGLVVVVSKEPKKEPKPKKALNNSKMVK